MSYCVMPGLDPGIHAFFPRQTDVDGRDKPGHDGGEADEREPRIAICDCPSPARAARRAGAISRPQPKIRIIRLLFFGNQCYDLAIPPHLRGA